MPKVRTATIAESRVSITGRSEARTISHPEVAVRAMPEAVAAPPSSPATTIAGLGRRLVTPGAASGETDGAAGGV
jgi:hypothetical protein